MKRMKDIIPIEQQRVWKPAYLNRLVSKEMRRREIFKELFASGITGSKAYEISLRRMK